MVGFHVNISIPKHVIVAATGWVGRLTGAIAQIIMIRLVISYLGINNYAIFAILYGLVGWFQLADFGLGASLQNFISECRSSNITYSHISRVVVRASLLLFIVELIVLWVGSKWIGAWLLSPFALTVAEQRGLFLFAAIFLLAFSLGQVVTRIYYAERRGHITNLVFAGAQILGCFLAWVTMRFNCKPGLSWALGAFLLPSALSMTAFLIATLFRERPTEPLGAGQLSLILRRAFGFAWFSISAAFVLQIDVIVLSRFLGAYEITRYSILSKVMAFIFVLFSEALMALWPMITECLALRDFKRVHQWVGYYLAGGGIFVIIACLGLRWKGDAIFEILAPHSVGHLPVQLLALLGVYYLVRVWSDTFAMLLQSTSNLLHLWWAVPAQGALSFGLQWVLVPRHGSSGVVGALILSYALTVVWILPMALKRAFALARVSQP